MPIRSDSDYWAYCGIRTAANGHSAVAKLRLSEVLRRGVTLRLLDTADVQVLDYSELVPNGEHRTIANDKIHTQRPFALSNGPLIISMLWESAPFTY